MMAVVPPQKQTLHNIAAAMIARAASEAKGAPRGIVGSVVEEITGQVKEFNQALEAHTKIQVKQLETQNKVNKTLDKLATLEAKINTHQKMARGERKKTIEAIKQHKKELESLNREYEENSEELKQNGKELDKMRVRGGVVGNSLKFLAGKAAGAATAYFGFSNALESVEKRMQMSAVQIQMLGQTTDGYWKTLGRVREGYGAWNDAINKATASNVKFGIGVQETRDMVTSLSRDLRLSTDDYQNMAQIVGQTTEDIGFLSKVLQINADDLAKATVDASRKFNKSTKAMGDELAGLYKTVEGFQQANKDLRFNIGDMTKAVLEAQSSFQGYNFNLRQTAQVMGKVAEAAQRQGATYEMAMKGAEGLVGIISGGRAPDWAKYMAGDKLLNEIKGIAKKAEIGTDAWAEEMGKTMGFDPKTPAGQTQLQGLKTLSLNYKKYGGLSSKYMAEELLRGTEKGSEEMFNLIRKYGAGPEGRELLKQVWGLDDAAATAATLALDAGQTWEKFSGTVKDLEAKTAERKPPSVADLRAQTGDYVSALATAQEGVSGTIKNQFDSLRQNPAISAILGAMGTGTTAILQLVQSGAMAGMAGKMGVAGFGGASGGLGKVAGGVVKGAGAAGGIAMAAGIGWELGKILRSSSKALSEFTGITYLSVDKLAELGLDTLAEVTKKLSFGFIDLAKKTDAGNLAVAGFTSANQKATEVSSMKDKIVSLGAGKVEKGSADWAKAASFLRTSTEEEIEGLAESIAKHDKSLSESEVKAKLMAAKAAGIRTPFSGKTAEASAVESAGKPATPGSGTGAQPAPASTQPIIVPRLTERQEQAAAIKVSEQLAPEVRGMGRTLFEGMAKQSTDYYTQLTSTSETFWTTTLPDQSAKAWDTIVDELQRKFGVGGMVPIPVASEGGAPGAKGAAGTMGMGAAVGPDGSINIRLTIPRNALDKSNRQSDGYTG